ncbi:MAG: twin-arginine translocation signal domain-containing protein [Candidatus Hydrothermarchaeales archaeon]
MRDLEGNVQITRRNFLKLSGFTIASALLPGCLTANDDSTQSELKLVQRPFIELYGELPRPAEEVVHDLRRYRGGSSNSEPRIMDNGHSELTDKIREALELLKKQRYQDYVYVSEVAGGKGISLGKGDKIFTRDGMIYVGIDNKHSSMGELACDLVHESVHVETTYLESKGIIKLPEKVPELYIKLERLAIKAQGECLVELDLLKENVDDYVERILTGYDWSQY